MNTAHKKRLKSPMDVIAPSTNAARPAAGPLTLRGELLSEPITMPPIIPDIIPLKKGAPEASAIPRQSGKATKNTTSPEGKSLLRFAKKVFCLYIVKTQAACLD
jgi:hypothetical protein